LPSRSTCPVGERQTAKGVHGRDSGRAEKKRPTNPRKHLEEREARLVKHGDDIAAFDGESAEGEDEVEARRAVEA
jgi:hypothetical protein